MRDLPQTLTINQALFGYSDGHRRLAASVQLSSNDTYELATRSDLASNARLGPGGSYIGGFTLKDSGAFAFIKTWSAPEMPRPGCVWSHVLLLPRKFLVGQVNLGVLRTLFRRPDPTQPFDAYGTTIDVKRLLKSEPADRVETQRIISAYYEGRPLHYTELPGEIFEEALLAAWSQQWPKLRSDFVFRMVFSSVSVEEKGLIVKIGPPSAAGSASDTPVADASIWMSAAVDDATSSTITPLRRFLWRYGKDTARPREAFRPLVELYLGERASSKLSPDAILKAFPEPLDAATLKRDVLGAPTGALALSPRLDGRDFVTLAIQGAAVSTGLIKPDELVTAVSSFDQRDLKRAAIALGRAEPAPNSQDEMAVKEAVSRFIGADALADDAVPKSFVTDVLAMRPDLIETFDAERLDGQDVLKLLPAATSKTSVRRLIGSLMPRPPSVTSQQAVNRWMAEVFVEAVRHSTKKSLHEQWRQFFPHQAHEAISKGLGELSGSKEVSHAAVLIDFSMDHRATPFEFVEACDREGPSATTAERTELDAYLLIMCSRWGLAKSMIIVADVLPRLRRVALADGFSERARALLDRRLPYLSDMWDLNKRLLKLLRDARRDGVNIEDLIEPLALSEDELLYVFDSDNDTLRALISKFFWPLYRA